MSFGELLRNEEHEEIASLEGEEFNPYRAIAYINLGRYAEALRCAKKGSFEMAYILYKLKRYRRALRILRKLSDDGSRVLASQCLYYLGYYNSAYRILSGFKRDDEIVVNLQAMKSLALLAHKSKGAYGRKFSVPAKDELEAFENLDRYKFPTPELRADFVFNKAFEYLDDEDRFVEYLEERVGADPGLRGTIVEEQLKNIRKEFDMIDAGLLGRSQRETVAFNTGKIKEFSEPVHYQQNMPRMDIHGMKHKEGDLPWLSLVYGRNFDLNFNDIPALNEKLRLLRCLVALKNGKFSRRCIRSNLRDVPDSIHKQLLFFLVDFKPLDPGFQDAAKELLSKAMQQK
jgi:hypothetical protein